MKQLELLQFAADVLERLKVRYAIVGSYGSYTFGEPRSTKDIDILADLKRIHINGLCDSFPPPRYYVSEDAVRHAIEIRFQFNVIDNETLNKIDFMLPRDDEWGRTQLDRVEQVSLLPGRLVLAASREDIILGKLLYFAEGHSDKHVRDIKGILRVSRDKVDRKLIEEWAKKLNVLEAWNLVLMHPEEEK